MPDSGKAVMAAVLLFGRFLLDSVEKVVAANSALVAEAYVYGL